MSDTSDGRPENPEQDSEGHVIRVDGVIDLYRWVSASQWFEDRKGRWVAPSELVADCDEYLGRCISTTELADREAAAYQRGQEAMREAAAQTVECSCENAWKVSCVQRNSAERWNLCGRNPCAAIDAAAIRDLPIQPEARDGE